MVPNGAQYSGKPFLLATFNASKLLGPLPHSIPQLEASLIEVCAWYEV